MVDSCRNLVSIRIGNAPCRKESWLPQHFDEWRWRCSHCGSERTRVSSGSRPFVWSGTNSPARVPLPSNLAKQIPRSTAPFATEILKNCPGTMSVTVVVVVDCIKHCLERRIWRINLP